MTKTGLAVVWLCAVVPDAALAQTPAHFEVAAIRPAAFPNGEYFAGYVAAAGTCGPGRMEQAGPRITFRHVTLCGLIRFAYDVKDYQGVEMPGWMKREEPSTFFDVDARTEGETPRPADQVREMVSSLIRDRFQLLLHTESRELPVYALTVDAQGPKLTGGAHERCQSLMKGVVSAGPGTCFGMTMASVDGQVSIFTAIQEQLGLKLVPQRLSVAALVVDRAERPSPN